MVVVVKKVGGFKHCKGTCTLPAKNMNVSNVIFSRAFHHICEEFGSKKGWLQISIFANLRCLIYTTCI